MENHNNLYSPYAVYVYKMTNGNFVVYPATIKTDSPELECQFIYFDWFRDNARIECQYNIHKNVIANLPNTVKLPDSYLFDYNFNGLTHECPLIDTNIFDIDEIIYKTNSYE